MNLSKLSRQQTARDRRDLIAAIGAGKVYSEAGRHWRRTSWSAPGAGVHRPKVPVARRHLDQLVDDGLAVLGPDDRWQLTHTGTLHNSGGAA